MHRINTKTNRLMLWGEISVVCCENHIKTNICSAASSNSSSSSSSSSGGGGGDISSTSGSSSMSSFFTYLFCGLQNYLPFACMTAKCINF